MVSLRKDNEAIGALLIAIIIVVALVAAGGVVYYLYWGGNPDESPYSLQEGDYVEYTHSPNTYRLEVVSIGESTMIVNYTMNIGGWVYSQLNELPLNQTLMLDFSYTNPPPGYTVSYLGKEDLDTNWGSKSADHYRTTYEEGGSEMAIDLWLKRGVLLSMLVTYQGYPQGYTNLTATNLSFIAS